MVCNCERHQDGGIKIQPHRSIRYMSLVTPCAQMLDAFFPVLADRFHNVEVSLWNALVHENTANFH